VHDALRVGNGHPLAAQQRQHRQVDLAAHIAGAVLGGIIGNNVARDSNQYEYRDDTSNTVRRCRTVYDNNNNSAYGNYEAYKVTYRYAGQTYTGFTDYRPGRTIRVRVNVRLQEDNLRYGNNR